MAPIPSIIPSLCQPLVSSIDRRLASIKEHDLPRLKECKGPLSLQQDIARDVRGEIIRTEKAIEELEELAEDLDDEHERIEVKERCTFMGGELADIRKGYRVALLASKRAIDANPAAMRDELLYSKNQSLKNTQTDDPVQEKANQVTNALRQTNELMKQELDQSVMSAQLLDEQTASLRTTTTLYQTYSSLLTTSNSLLSALESSNYTDRILILAALLFFLLVCAYILKKRIWDRTVGGALGWVFGGGSSSAKKGLVKKGVQTARRGIGMVTGTAAVSVAGAMQTGAASMEERLERGMEEGKADVQDLLSSVVPVAPQAAVSSPVPADEAIIPLDPPGLVPAGLPRDEL